MIISIDTHLAFPCELVYVTYRDRITELVPYMPNVLAIEVESRHQEGDKVYCVTHWQGGGEIPGAVRALLGEGVLSWTEYDVWDNTNETLEWRIEPHVLAKAVYCGGKNRFLDQGSSTLIENRGQLTIDSQQIHGIPHFLSRQMAHVAEEFRVFRIWYDIVTVYTFHRYAAIINSTTGFRRSYC